MPTVEEEPLSKTDDRKYAVRSGFAAVLLRRSYQVTNFFPTVEQTHGKYLRPFPLLLTMESRVQVVPPSRDSTTWMSSLPADASLE